MSKNRPADILVYTLADGRCFAQRGEARSADAGRFLQHLMGNQAYVTTPMKRDAERFRASLTDMARGWGLSVALADRPWGVAA